MAEAAATSERGSPAPAVHVVDVAVVGDGAAGLAAVAALRAQGRRALLLSVGEHPVGAELAEALGLGVVAVPGGPLVWDAGASDVERLVDAAGLLEHVAPLSSSASRQLVVRDGKLQPMEPGGLLRWASVVSSLWTRAMGVQPEQHDRASAAPLSGRLRALPGGLEAVRDALAGPDAAAGTGRDLVLVDVSFDSAARAWVFAARQRTGGVSARIHATHVVVATPPSHLPGPARAALGVDEMRDGTSGIVPWPVALVGWEEAHTTEPGRATEGGLPRAMAWWRPSEQLGFGFATVCTSEMTGGEPALPRRYLTLVGGPHAPQHAELQDHEIERALREEVRALGGRLGRVLGVERRTHLALASENSAGVSALRDRLVERGVVWAGAWLAGGSLDDAVRSGFAAARAIAGEPPGHRGGDEAADVPGVDVVPPSAPAPEAESPRSDTPAPPLFVLGVAYRDAPTDVRARLAALERGPEAPSRALVQGGYADGVVVLETCSRVEWVVSSRKPRWAMELLKSSLALRAPEARFHVRVGHAAAHYLMRVAMGLDSVAEGEPAVGRQLVLAFERGHREGDTDRTLRLCWRAVQQLLGDRRRRGVVQHGLGVQTLVLEELRARGVQPSDRVLVYGQGEIGRAVSQALRDAGFSHGEGHRRATHEAFLLDVPHARAVVVCTGGPAPFLEVPARPAGVPGVVVDVGVPEQVKSAPGWTRVTLEELLQQPRRLLDDETRAWLVAQVGQVAERLARELALPPPAGTLSSIDEERRIFLRETLPPLLEKLPQPAAEEVRKAVATFAHHLIERVREGGVQ